MHKWNVFVDFIDAVALCKNINYIDTLINP